MQSMTRLQYLLKWIFVLHILDANLPCKQINTWDGKLSALKLITWLVAMDKSDYEIFLNKLINSEFTIHISFQLLSDITTNTEQLNTHLHTKDW